jgi:hypothetical protein
LKTGFELFAWRKGAGEVEFGSEEMRVSAPIQDVLARAVVVRGGEEV